MPFASLTLSLLVLPLPLLSVAVAHRRLRRLLLALGAAVAALGQHAVQLGVRHVQVQLRDHRVEKLKRGGKGLEIKKDVNKAALKSSECAANFES